MKNKLTSAQKFKIAKMYSASLLLMTEVGFKAQHISDQDHSEIVSLVHRIGDQILSEDPKISDFDSICDHVISNYPNTG